MSGYWVARCRCGSPREVVPAPEKLDREHARLLDWWSDAGYRVGQQDTATAVRPCTCPEPHQAQRRLFEEGQG